MNPESLDKTLSPAAVAVPAKTAHYSVHGAVAVLTLDHPPVNALAQSVRAAVRTHLQRANEDAAIGAIVIIGSQTVFSAGADVKESRTAKDAEANRLGMKYQDTVDKPIVAAVGGYALGGGLEFALCSHYRIATPKTRLGLPEVRIGRVPSSGGTQRLPRLIGVARAARMLLYGEPMSAEQALEAGLIDEIVDGDLLEGAVHYARRLIAERKGPRRISQLRATVDNAAAFFAAQRAELERTHCGYSAPLQILECLQASVTLPFDEGKAVEERNGDLARESQQAKGLQYAFMAERAAAKISDVTPATVRREIRQVAIIGAADVDANIAKCFERAGIPARSWNLDSGKGDGSGLADADLIVIAGHGNNPFKNHDMQRALKSGAIILAITPDTPVADRIPADGSRSHDIIGMRLDRPSHETRLLEFVRRAETSAEVVASVVALAKRMDKVAVVVRVAGIGERMLAKSMNQMTVLLEEGASRAQIDEALMGWGYAASPFVPGQTPDRNAGAPPRAIDSEEIIARWTFALVNEAAYILDEGGAARASDIDTICFLRHGFPRYRGGPLFYADTVGVDAVLRSIEQFAGGYRGELWTPAPLLRAHALVRGAFTR